MLLTPALFRSAKTLGTAKSDCGALLIGTGVTAIGGGEVFRGIRPGPAPQHAIDSLFRPSRVFFWRPGIVVLLVPIGAPFPNVSGHVAESECVFGKLADPAWAVHAIVVGQLVRGFVLSPRVFQTITQSARRPFPCCFGGETFSAPLAIGIGVLPGDVYDGMLLLGAFRLSLGPIVGRGSTGVAEKFGELRVRNLVLVYIERVENDRANRAVVLEQIGEPFAVVVGECVGSPPEEVAAGDEDHCRLGCGESQGDDGN